MPLDATAATQPTLSPTELSAIHRYWSACNYISACMIYLRANPILREPLAMEHIKRRLLGHWGSDPGQSLIWVHMNRLIKKYDLNAIYISGPGHGAPATLSNAYLEGTYSEVYPDKSQDEAGLLKFFRQFSFPGGIGSHCTPETPGSIHEGGELGYSLSHAYGAAFDNPSLIVTCCIGDGEAETGPLATSWHSNKFLNPIRDGAVLPILHLNGYKIANPTILARIPHEELEALMRGYGYTPYFVEGNDPQVVHQQMAATLEAVVLEIRRIQTHARDNNDATRPRWPMIVLRTPKGWTGPKTVDGHKVEDFWRSHQVPIAAIDNPAHLADLDAWLRSYAPETLFDARGTLIPELQALAPTGLSRISANPHANGGLLRKPLNLPDFRTFAYDLKGHGKAEAAPTDILAHYLAEVMRRNMTTFRVFGPDETASNRLQAIYAASKKTWNGEYKPEDADGGELALDGRVMEMLSEHTLEGWFEGYVLTGRHGFFSTYEAFVHVIDSMFNQHAKWLEASKKEARWRAPISSINLLITSLVWRQDHNGFTHQDPGFLDHVINKKADVVRVYLPPDGNCLLSVVDHCLRSRDYVNVVVASKHSRPQWLAMEDAIVHCTKGIGIWQWASNDQDARPDVVMACCGETPTLEVLAAVSILRAALPELKIRVINVVDLMRLQPASEHPHGMSEADYDALFTRDVPIVFAFHGYPWLVHRLTYARANRHLHVRGYKEEGTITTPFDMRVQNDIDRFHLVQDVIDRVSGLGSRGDYLRQAMRDKLIAHKHHIYTCGEDMPEIRHWKWGALPEAPTS